MFVDTQPFMLHIPEGRTQRLCQSEAMLQSQKSLSGTSF